MSYPSVDSLQKALCESVFHYAADKKKAAGRALFLTDAGLSDFINELLLAPTKKLAPASAAFRASYTAEKKGNRFTKVQMDALADKVLVRYFSDHKERIESWFNVIAPHGGNLDTLRTELITLRKKNWTGIFTA